jgi:hypothetical protein
MNSNSDERVYIFVPFEYKEDAKKLGAKWDASKKQWYALKANANVQILVDMYHINNFIYDFQGYHYSFGARK